MEQGLEADARLACSRHPATDDGDTDGATANGKGATAAAMQYGYWRGNILRGVRNALRGPRQALDSIQRYRARNVANPRVGSRMQQACDPFAAETGEVVRNHEVGTRWMSLGAHSPKPDESSSGGSGRKRSCRWKGERRAVWTADQTTRTNPKREGREIGQGDRFSLRRGAKTWRIAPRRRKTAWARGERCHEGGPGDG